MGSIRATQPSSVVLPETGSANPTTVFAYLCARFPQVGAEAWRARMAEGNVHWKDGTVLHAESSYQPRTRVFYYREVSAEPVLPFVRRRGWSLSTRIATQAKTYSVSHTSMATSSNTCSLGLGGPLLQTALRSGRASRITTYVATIFGG